MQDISGMTPQSGLDFRRYHALLEVAESIALHRDLPALFHELSERLHQVVQFNYLNLILHDEIRGSFRLHILTAPVPISFPVGMEWPAESSLALIVLESGTPFLVSDLENETRFPAVVNMMRENGIQCFCMLPLKTAQRRVGILGFGSTERNAYSDQDVQFMQQVARQVAVAVDNALNYAKAFDYQKELARERDRLSLLLEVNNALVSNLDIRELFKAASTCLRRVMQYEYTSLALFDPEKKELRLHAVNFPEGIGPLPEDHLLSLETSPAGRVFTSRIPTVFSYDEISRLASTASSYLLEQGLRSLCGMPLLTRNGILGTLNVGSRRDNAFPPETVDLLSSLASQIAIAIENALAYREIAELKNRLNDERLYLEDEIRSDYGFEEIIGESRALKRILKQVRTVAPTDTTVLVCGETGTGKELIARAIHNLSPRRERTLVKVNCAAIPTGLLESDLFGHEKGAFTGAITQKVGRFEIAHKGTLFLDEIGEIPLELQPKLLRVLQEKEFERLGGTRTIRVDVRLIAATNQDLSVMVAERRFRNDLYYRLNIFPITIPPLRQRPEDIQLLVHYFAQEFSRRLNKRIETIASETMEALCRYSWPGNIRELQNVIEHAVILSEGPELRVRLSSLASIAPGTSTGATTLAEAEREHILRTLQETRWIIAGPRGAAARLGMKRTTLQSKMQKLGIRRS